MCCENKLLRLSPDKIEEIRSLIKKMGEKLKPKTPKPDYVEPVIEKRTCETCGLFLGKHPIVENFYHCVEVPLFASLCPCEEWTPKPLVEVEE